jgi:HrpA-like RNA helicase
MEGGEYPPDYPAAADRALDGKLTELRKSLPIFPLLRTIDFAGHFAIIGDVGTGKSTVTPIHEFELHRGRREIVVREPSRATCNALYYSLMALHPEAKDDLAIITKDTKVNVGGKVKIVTDGVLLRMLAEKSVADSSVYFDECHQMSSQLELCLSLAKAEKDTSGNLLRVMSATIDPREFLRFLGINNLYSLTGRRFPVRIETQTEEDFDGMLHALSSFLHAQSRNESWLVFLPTRRMVERYASSLDGVYIHGGLEGSEINRIQERAESDRGLRIFATNVIASSVNIYVDNVLIFNDVIDSKDRLGQKTLNYRKLDNNSLLQMIGRIGRFKPGRAVILTDTPIPKRIDPVPVHKALETETPFDLVLLMSKYGLKLADQEFMSKVNHREVAFAEDWLAEIGAINGRTHQITRKGQLMSEIPYEPDFAHLIASALTAGDIRMARFLLACGAFGDSLNHAYKSDRESQARRFLYSFDRSNELNIKAHLLRGHSDDKDGSFAAKMASNGLFPRFVEEAWKSYEAALDGLNDLLAPSGKDLLPSEVVTDPDIFHLRSYLEEALSYERFELYEKKDYDLRDIEIDGQFFSRTVTMNYRRILFDTVAMPGRKSRRHRGRR